MITGGVGLGLATMSHFPLEALIPSSSQIDRCDLKSPKPSQRDCHQLPKWGILKEHVPPCVFLVINDNPYGLMFTLSYICRTSL
jgi:hypothetical protein